MQRMETLLSDHLHAICRALITTVSDGVSGEILACDLVQVDRREFHFQTVAAAHFPGSPVRRLLLGCEERLAQHFDTGAGDVHAGLERFCKRLQSNLCESGLEWATGQDFLVHDSNQFRVHCAGVRNFLFRIAVAEGRLDVVLDLAPRTMDCDWLSTEIASTGTTAVNANAEAITNPVLVRRIMTHLATAGADVQVKVPVDNDRLELLQATFLAREFDPESELLPLTCARRTSLEQVEDIPEKVILVFILQDKLLQCSCPVLDHDQMWLDDDIALPILRLGLPASVTYGQRRGAFRLEPPERVTGSVQRIMRGDGDPAMVAKQIPMEVCDISFTGAMLQLGNQAIISGFKGGTEVECVIVLPDDFGTVSVRAVVRRLHINHDDTGRGAVLGVEFVEVSGSETLETVRRYIQNRHTERLSHGSAELEIG